MMTAFKQMGYWLVGVLLVLGRPSGEAVAIAQRADAPRKSGMGVTLSNTDITLHALELAQGHYLFRNFRERSRSLDVMTTRYRNGTVSVEFSNSEAPNRDVMVRVTVRLEGRRTSWQVEDLLPITPPREAEATQDTRRMEAAIAIYKRLARKKLLSDSFRIICIEPTDLSPREQAKAKDFDLVAQVVYEPIQVKLTLHFWGVKQDDSVTEIKM